MSANRRSSSGVTAVSFTPGELEKKAGTSLIQEGGALYLLLCFGFWYLGNYYYNLYNKLSVSEAGGTDSGLVVTIATMQLAIGFVYAIAVWLLGTNPLSMQKQTLPKLTGGDLRGITMLSFWSAMAHVGSVFALTAGSPAFGQIVKAAEPVFAAIINTVLYGKPPSKPKAMTLPLIVLGVCIACLKPDKDGNYKVEFEPVALMAGSFANVAASFRGSENARLMALPGLKERIGGVGNQFALAQVMGFLVLCPLMLAVEGKSMGKFYTLATTNSKFAYNLLMAGLTFYGYNELSTMTIKHTSAVTMSVANTAKRVIVIVGVAIALGKPVTTEEAWGSFISITGVFLYSVADIIALKLRGGESKKTA